MFFPCLKPLVAGLALASVAVAGPWEDRVAALYRPLQGEQIALSPDGTRVAYSRHERGELSIYLMAVDQAERKLKIAVEDDRPVSFAKEKAPAELRFLRWATNDRLVFAPTPEWNGVREHAPIFAVNADGSDAKTLATADDFAYPTDTDFVARATVIHGLRPATKGAPARGVLLVEAEETDASWILVEALGKPARPQPVPTTFFRIDIATEKKVDLGEEFEAGRYLYDRDGRARVNYVQPLHATIRTFRHLEPGNWTRWREMDETWSSVGRKGFTFSVENGFGERAIPLGFEGDSRVLYFASNIGRDTFAVYGLDTETKQRTAFALEHPRIDLAGLEPAYPGSTLVYDERRREVVGVRTTGVRPFTLWTDSGIGAVQRELEQKLPQRTIEILEWDDARRRFLMRVTGGLDPGRYLVYQRPENLLVEVVQRAPWLRPAEMADTAPFEFDTPAGVHLSGYLTFPRKPRLTPPPLLVDFGAGFFSRHQPGFDPEVQMYAEMGFVVAQVNYRGTSGFGRQHRDALRAGIDRVPVDDVVAAIDWIAGSQPIDRRRVSAIGRGLGGFLALRALQLRPEVFRCAVAVNAVLDPSQWLQPTVEESLGAGPTPINFWRETQRLFLEKGTQPLASISVLGPPELLTKPVCLIVDPLRDRTVDHQNALLRSRLKRLGRAPQWVEAPPGFSQNLPSARAKIFREIQEFFTLNLYEFKVKVGESKEVK